MPVHTGSIPNTEPSSSASTGEYPYYQTSKCFKWKKAESAQYVNNPSTASTRSMSGIGRRNTHGATTVLAVPPVLSTERTFYFIPHYNYQVTEFPQG